MIRGSRAGRDGVAWPQQTGSDGRQTAAQVRPQHAVTAVMLGGVESASAGQPILHDNREVANE